jgi:uncharacterized phage protein (TIGR02216 family)
MPYAFLAAASQRRPLVGYLCDMAEKSTGAEALLAGMADEMAALVRAHFDALKEPPVVADTAAVEKMMKVITAVGRANLSIRAVGDGESPEVFTTVAGLRARTISLWRRRDRRRPRPHRLPRGRRGRGRRLHGRRRMTPWPQLLRLAATLGIEPEAFWRLSLAEWRALTGEPSDALSRQGFEALANRFPDEDA